MKTDDQIELEVSETLERLRRLSESEPLPHEEFLEALDLIDRALDARKPKDGNNNP